MSVEMESMFEMVLSRTACVINLLTLLEVLVVTSLSTPAKTISCQSDTRTVNRWPPSRVCKDCETCIRSVMYGITCWVFGIGLVCRVSVDHQRIVDAALMRPQFRRHDDQRQ